MELLLAVLGAGPLGFFVPNRRRALIVYLGLWAVVFPIQTVVVFHIDDSGDDAWYWVVNAVILAAGVGLNRLGATLAARRRARYAAA